MSRRKIITTHETFIKQCVNLKGYISQRDGILFQKRKYITQLKTMTVDEVRNERDALHKLTPEL